MSSGEQVPVDDYSPRSPEDEGVERILPVLEVMPLVVIGGFRHARRIYDELRDRSKKTELTLEEQKLLAEAEATCNCTGLALDRIWSRSPDRAQTIVTTLAHSPLDEDREMAALFIEDFTKRDRDKGIRLWRRLLEDTVASVSLEANAHLPSYVGVQEDFERQLEDAGLTRDDLGELRRYSPYEEEVYGPDEVEDYDSDH